MLELVHGNTQRAPLHGTEPIGRPPVGGRGDARVELRRALRDCVSDATRPGVDLARVLRADRLAREVPLVEQEERLPPRLAPRDRQVVTARSASSVEVE